MRYLIITYLCLVALKAVARQASDDSSPRAVGPGKTGIASIDNAQTTADKVGAAVPKKSTTTAPPDSDTSSGTDTSTSSGRNATTASTSTGDSSKSKSSDDAYAKSLKGIDDAYAKAIAKVNSGDTSSDSKSTSSSSSGSSSGSSSSSSSDSSTDTASAAPKDRIAMIIDACIQSCQALRKAVGVGLGYVSCLADCPRQAAGLSDGGATVSAASPYGSAVAGGASTGSDNNLGLLMQMLSDDSNSAPPSF